MAKSGKEQIQIWMRLNLALVDLGEVPPVLHILRVITVDMVLVGALDLGIAESTLTIPMAPQISYR